MALATSAAAISRIVMKLGRAPALACMLVSLAACSGDAPESETFYVFGTLVDVSLDGADPATEQAAFQRLQQLFQQLHRDLHTWEPGQLVSLNQAIALGQTEAVDQPVADLIRLSSQLEPQSGGRFNPAIGRLVSLWGFHTSDYPIHQPVPEQAAIDSLLQAHPSMMDVHLLAEGDGRWRVQSNKPQVELDFGGIAKGYAVDRAIGLLRGMGIKNAIVNAGGDLRAIGSNRGRNWRVAIENPLGGVIGVLEVKSGEAVFTSGNYQRFGEDQDGFRYAHILDPRTGWPVADVLSATVVLEDGAQADAAATALVVAGRKEWRDVAEGMGLEQLLLTGDDGTVYLTRALQERLEASAESRQRMVLLD